MLSALNLAESGFDPGVMSNLGMLSRILKDVETVYFSIDSKARYQQVLNFLGNVAADGYETDRETMTRPDGGLGTHRPPGQGPGVPGSVRR